MRPKIEKLSRHDSFQKEFHFESIFTQSGPNPTLEQPVECINDGYNKIANEGTKEFFDTYSTICEANENLTSRLNSFGNNRDKTKATDNKTLEPFKVQLRPTIKPTSKVEFVIIGRYKNLPPRGPHVSQENKIPVTRIIPKKNIKFAIYFNINNKGGTKKAPLGPRAIQF